MIAPTDEFAHSQFVSAGRVEANLVLMWPDAFAQANALRFSVRACSPARCAMLRILWALKMNSPPITPSAALIKGLNHRSGQQSMSL